LGLLAQLGFVLTNGTGSSNRGLSESGACFGLGLLVCGSVLCFRLVILLQAQACSYCGEDCDGVGRA
jgi:hypothetical protein